MAEDRMLSDEILLGIINSKSGGGGGGGTSNYNDLSNKPQIGGVTLSGNKTASDLGLVAAETDKGLSSNDYTDADKAIVGGVTAALAGKQNVLTAGNNIKIDNNTISVNRWAVPAGKDAARPGWHLRRFLLHAHEGIALSALRSHVCSRHTSHRTASRRTGACPTRLPE